MRFIFLISFLYLFTHVGLAQDSFEQLFEGTDIERVNKATYWFANRFNGADSNIALPQLKHLRDEAGKRGDEVMLLYADYQIAYYHVVTLGQEDFWLDQLWNETEKAKKLDELIWADLMHRNGIVYYFVKRDYAKGLGLLLRAHETMTNAGYGKSLRAATFLYELARIYYELGNYEKTIELLKSALHYPDTAQT